MCFYPSQITQLTECFAGKLIERQDFASSEYTGFPNLWFKPEQIKIKSEALSNRWLLEDSHKTTCQKTSNHTPQKTKRKKKPLKKRKKNNNNKKKNKPQKKKNKKSQTLLIYADISV